MSGVSPVIALSLELSDLGTTKSILASGGKPEGPIGVAHVSGAIEAIL
jgi:hypothetical protein